MNEGNSSYKAKVLEALEGLVRQSGATIHVADIKKALQPFLSNISVENGVPPVLSKDGSKPADAVDQLDEVLKKYRDRIH